jgi:hypothetical protein
VKGDYGQGKDNYYKYTEASETKNLHNKDLNSATDFTLITLDRYETGSTVEVGNLIETTGLKPPGFAIEQDNNQGYKLKSKEGQKISGNFIIKTGDYLTLPDQTTYQWIDIEANLLLADITAANGNASLASSGKWQQVAILANNQTYTVTAVVKGDAASGDQLVLAKAKPHEIDGRGAPGTAYEVYKTETAKVDGSSTSAIDIANNEIQFNQIGGQYTPINSGQLITYFVLADEGSSTKPTDIGGLKSAQNYYVILRGPGRIALAATLEDVWKNNAIDIKGVGTGKNHFFRHESGRSDRLS